VLYNVYTITLIKPFLFPISTLNEILLLDSFIDATYAMTVMTWIIQSKCWKNLARQIRCQQ